MCSAEIAGRAGCAIGVSVFDQQKKEFDRIVELNRDLLQRIDELQKE